MAPVTPAAAGASDSTDGDEKVGPRPLSDAERAAVELAIAYLDAGPEAWWERLADDSPLRELDHREALAEIEARAGPPLEAEWQLQTPAASHGPNLAVFTIGYPSGLDETLSLTLDPDDGWRIVEVRSLIDPARPRPGLVGISSSASPPPGAGPGTPRGADRPHPGSIPGGVAAPIAALIAALIAIGTLAAAALAAARGRRGRPAFEARAAGAARAATAPGGVRAVALGARRALPSLLTLAALLAGGAALGALLACRGDGGAAPGGPPAAAPPGDALVRLGALVPLRRVLADGTDAGRIQALLDAAPGEGPVGHVARLWRAEQRLWRFELREVEKLLSALPKEPRVPLAELLRARLALLRGDAEGAEEGYRELLVLGPDHDGARMEMAQAQTYLDSTAAGEITFELVGEMGSRLADVYYALAELAAINNEPERGEDLFRVAWGLNPAERAEIFGSPGLSHLAARPTLFPTFGFGSAEEPRVEPPAGERRPVALPAGATATLAGQLLRVAVGSGRLAVPGGWTLAPARAVVEDAASERVREEERALARLPALVEATGGGILAHPRRREQAMAAAFALARHNRWEDLVALTDGLGDEGERLPPLLARLRALALKQVDRPDEAKVLLYRLAKRDLVDRRRDPGNLTQLGELFAATGDYELAIRLLRRAGALSPYGVDDGRIRQLTMDQELAASYDGWKSRYFDLRYPRETGEKYVRQLDAVLAEERQRLRQWIPVGAGHDRIEVALFPLLRFMTAYSGGIEVVGIYDGKVRVPFADLRSLHPELVRILTHELAHAMIAEVTDDQAPHWFQEGLAQHVEMGTGPINPIPDLHRAGRILAFPMVDPILRGFSEPQLVELAYAESAWAVHYIEARAGVEALHRMQRAFAAGLTTEEALGQVLGMSAAEFDRAAWEWCRAKAPSAWVNRVRRYDLEYDSLIERSEFAGGVEPRTAPPAGAAGALAPAPARAATPRAGSAPSAGAMTSWHRAYAARAQPVKRALSAVLPLLQGGAGGDAERSAAACGELSSRVKALLDDPEALAPPAAEVGRQLRLAYESFGFLAEACRQGNLGQARNYLSRAERALGRAASDLAPHGLEP